MVATIIRHLLEVQSLNASFFVWFYSSTAAKNPTESEAW